MIVSAFLIIFGSVIIPWQTSLYVTNFGNVLDISGITEILSEVAIAFGSVFLLIGGAWFIFALIFSGIERAIDFVYLRIKCGCTHDPAPAMPSLEMY